ncbi:MAG TPA: hypothetical protein VIT93_02665 [Dehalococcoidia bacterium]
MTQRHHLAELSIAFIWAAVGVVGVFGKSITVTRNGDRTEVPIVAGVALFAAIATAFVARFGLRGHK